MRVSPLVRTVHVSRARVCLTLELSSCHERSGTRPNMGDATSEGGTPRDVGYRLTEDAAAIEAMRKALELDWGIWPHWPDWPWATKIRILFVIDGERITEGSSGGEFGLGPVLDTLRDISFAYWVRFLVTLRDRDTGFRFTDADFDIDQYDQIWFFGDWPAEEANDPSFPDSRIEDAKYGPMTDAELELLAAWMNAGGGVFATGDHTLLGASMCHKIPRVRSMRQWTHAQGVPSFADSDRNETLQGRPAIGPDAAEGDRYPQRIYPVFRRDSDWPFIFGQWPHPLLCGPNSVIDEFPDHMHEGAVIEDADVVLNDKLLPGSTEDEYPIIPIVVGPTVAAGPPVGGEPFVRRVRPRVIAHGMTTNLESPRTSFAMIAAFDGDPADVGRVVVDSTWHHWFSMNLIGLRDQAPGFYRNMQAYYRNIGLWLATPAQRASMLFWATWGALVGSQPGLFDPALGIYGMGERVLDVLGRTAPQCIVSELVATVIRRRSDGSAAQVPPTTPSTTPWEEFTRPPTMMVNQAIVGGIAVGMFDLAKGDMNKRARGRTPRIDAKEIRAAGIRGLAIGTQELRHTLETAASRFRSLADERLPDPYLDLVDKIQVGETLDDEADKNRRS